jgi:exonuclease VII small subunit
MIDAIERLEARIEVLERLVADYQDAVMESDKLDERLTALEQRVVYGPTKSRRKKAEDD